MPFSDNERALALQRALKFAKLFKGNTFDEIMDAVQTQPNPDKIRFAVACQGAGLVQSEIEWLWNYLVQCKKKYWDLVPEAAATGW
jgi:hypothetical protein